MKKKRLNILRNILASLVFIVGLSAPGTIVAQSISGMVVNQSTWLNNQSLLPPQWHVPAPLGTVVAGQGRIVVALLEMGAALDGTPLDLQPLAPTNMITLVDLSTIIGANWSYSLGSMLKEGNYRVMAWVDGNNNSAYDVGEPHGYANARISGTSPANNITVTIQEDSDSDAMPDWWEVHWFGNLAQTGSMDFDNDGLTNGEEYALIQGGTYVRPNHWDTDGDGMDDAWELFYGLNPVNAIGVDGANGDPDGDQVSNINEYRGPDGIGWRAGYPGYGIAEFTTSRDALDPRDADSDHDGIPDGQEFYVGLTHPVSPMNSTNIQQRSLQMNVAGGAGAAMTDPTGNTFAFGDGGGTVECWVYPQTDGNGVLYSFPAAELAGAGNFRISLDNFRPKLQIMDGLIVKATVGGTNVMPSAGSIQQLEPNRWTHLAFVIEPLNKSVVIYVNGVLLIAQTTLVNMNFVGTPTICRDFTDGYLDELRVWNYPRAISDIEYWANRYYPAPGYVKLAAHTRSGRDVKMYEYDNPLRLYLRFDDGGNAVENFAFLNSGLYPNFVSYRISGPITAAVTTDQAVPMFGSDDADGDELPEWWVDLYNMEKYQEYETSAIGPEMIRCPEDSSLVLGIYYYRSFVGYASIGNQTAWLEAGNNVFYTPKTRPDFYEGDNSSYTKHVYLFSQPRTCPLNIYTPGMTSTVVYVNGQRVTTAGEDGNAGQQYDVAQYMRIGRNTVHVECKSTIYKSDLRDVPYSVADYQAYNTLLPSNPLGCDGNSYQFTVAVGKFDAELVCNGMPVIVRGDKTRADPRAVWHVQLWSTLFAESNFVPLPDLEGRDARSNPDYGVPLHAERDNNPLDPDVADDGLNAVYEYIGETNPRERDSNNNGVTDGDEDYDNDGLVNREEQRFGSSPWLADSDDDGIYDGIDIGEGHPAQSLSPQQNLSLRFGGLAGDYITMPHQQRFALDKWSIEAWIQPDADELDGGILAQRAVGGGAVNYEVGLNASNQPYVRYVSAASGVEVRATGSAAVVADGATWTHVAATYYNRKLSLFINGTNVATVTGNVSPTLYAGGPVQQRIGTGFKGCIDEWRLWKIELTSALILAHRDEVLTGLESDLVAYYRFDDGTSYGTTGSLVGTSANNGTNGALPAVAWQWGQVEDNVLRYSSDWWLQWKHAASFSGNVTFSTNHIMQGPPRLQVFIENDDAITAGARWSYNGGASWNESGFVETHLSAGNYNISFNTINGWITPAALPLSLVRGQSTTVTGAYVQTASLMVIIDNPANIQSVAKWSIDGGITMLGTGVQVLNLAPGAPGFSILFSEISELVSGWGPPAPIQVELLAGQARTVSASYQPIKGSLQISFTPTNVPATALWRVSGNTNWWGNDAIVTNLSFGNHQIEYNTVAWWRAPASEIIQITSSDSYHLSRTWEKLPEPSAVTVTLMPGDAVLGGARWSMDGIWYDSGQSTVVTPGEHLISYRPVAGWLTPRDVRVSALSSSIQVTGTYYQVNIAGSAEVGEFITPWGLAATPRLIYASDFGNHRVQVLDRVSGRWVSLGGPGKAAGKFNQPMGLAIAPNGDLWVADTGNHRVQCLSVASGAWTAFGSQGNRVGQFTAPYDLDVDTAGNVYVADYHNSRVQKRSTNGTWSVFIQGGTQDGYVRYPSGIAVDASGQVYVSDYDPTGEGFTGRVQKFSVGGDFLERLGTSEDSNGGLNQNMGLDLTQDGTLLLANTFDNEVLLRSTSAVWSVGAPDGMVQRPRDVASDTWGNIIVSDSGNNRILVLPATDRDGDGLPDTMEIDLGTDPLNPDSDGDGVSDGDEARLGSNPLDALSHAIARLAPANSVTLTARRPAFEWPAVPFAPWYQLFINRNGQNYLQQWVQGTNIWNPSQDLASGTYTWWVRPWGDLIGYGAWSAPADFKIALMIPGVLSQIAPLGAQALNKLTYQWQKDVNATWYHLWVSRNGGGTFYDRWYPMSGGGIASVVVDAHWQGNYAWWVESWGPDGAGPWTGPMAFSTPNPAPAQPVVVAPIGPIATPLPLFQWQLTPRAEWYRVYVTRNGVLIFDRWTQNLNLPSPMVLTSGVHTWWVASWNQLSNTTVWSPPINFTVP